jgi:hypothetical protein
MQRTLFYIWAAHALLCLGLITSTLAQSGVSAVADGGRQQMSTAAAVDPDKASSELNHHIAGLFLIAIGVSIIVSERYQRVSWLRWLAPLLFAMAGLFLLAWSDDEIWPRGALSWTWMLSHDAEARQHKLYGLLLLTIGAVQAMQLIPRMQRRSLKIVFPVLCAIGGVSLVFHHHSKESTSKSVAQAATGPQTSEPYRLDASNTPTHHHHADHTATAGAVAAQAEFPDAAGSHHHEHSRIQEKIKNEHAWFAVVGFWIALFKLMYDYTRPTTGIRRYLWPNSVILLGFLLLLYTE